MFKDIEILPYKGLDGRNSYPVKPDRRITKFFFPSGDIEVITPIYCVDTDSSNRSMAVNHIGELLFAWDHNLPNLKEYIIARLQIQGIKYVLQ